MQLSNHLLIAMPGLDDPDFSQAVTYICEHNPKGAMGLILNKPSNFPLSELFEQLGLNSLNSEQNNRFLLHGGPVEPEHGFIIHQPIGQWEASMAITQDIALTSSRDILKAISEGNGPEHNIIALGYAGWGPGQLEQELSSNAWLTVEATPELLFNTPTELIWQHSAHSIGVDFSRMSHETGHA